MQGRHPWGGGGGKAVAQCTGGLQPWAWEAAVVCNQAVSVCMCMRHGQAGAEAASEDVLRAVAAVRSDSDPCCWCLLGYSADKVPKLMVEARGDGAAEEMAAHLAQDALLYALVRVKQTIDTSLTVKFALVSWVRE